eukprot:scaffold2702_cov116-Isochrysis_galbana.AAC.7
MPPAIRPVYRAPHLTCCTLKCALSFHTARREGLLLAGSIRSVHKSWRQLQLHMGGGTPPINNEYRVEYPAGPVHARTQAGQ